MSAGVANAVAAAAGVWAWLVHPAVMWQFRIKTGCWPRAGMPRTYAEKMLWRRLFDRNPLFTTMCDKLKAKDYARSRSSRIKIPRTLWRGTRPEDIPAETLNGPVIVKTNHGCKFNRVVLGDVDRPELEAEFNRWLRITYGVRNLQWGYHDVEPGVFVEELLGSGAGPVGEELKFHVFGGQVYLCNLILDRLSAPRSCAFDRHGSRIGSIGKYGDAGDLPLPTGYQDAVAAVEDLCQGVDYVRCDVYILDDDVYFGEFTVYPNAGFVNLRRSEIMEEMSRRWDLRVSWFISTPQTGFRRTYVRALDRLLAD